MKRRILSVLLAVVLVVSFSLVTAAPVSATDGSGICTVSPTEVVVGSTNNTLTFTFTANETMDGGAITITAPADWSAPQGNSGTDGYTTANSTGTLFKVLTSLDATDNWSASTGNITLSADNVTFNEESPASLKAAIADLAAAGDKWYYDFSSSENWSSYTKVGFWIRSSVVTSSGNLTFAIAEDANLTAPTDNISIPGLTTAGQWAHVTLGLDVDGTKRDEVLSYGIVMTDDIGAADVFLDEILIGPDNANAISFAGQVTTARILALANTETITVVYGVGGGDSGATAQQTAGTATFVTMSKLTEGSLTELTVGSPEVTVNPGPATQLAFTTQPAGSVSSIALTTQPVVEARDQYGNKDASYVANVVAATDDLGTLTGTTTKAAVAGVATFTDLIYTATADGETFQIDVTSEGLTGATSNDVVSNVVTSQPFYTPRAGAGGDDAPPQPPIETNLFGVEVSFRISSEGEILETIEATSEDGKITITIPKGTIALDKHGNPLDSLETAVDESPPSPPEGAHVIGLAYDFGPDGATFDPPITLEYTYAPAEVPEGVAEEDLVIAYYDEDAGEWVECECTCDPETHCVTACVCHFTTFATIGAPKPAAFALSSLVISPAEVAPGEEVNISLSLANTGGLEGSYTVVLKINGVKEAEQSATIAAGTSKTVTSIVTKEEAGSYSVTVDGMSGSFVVVAPLVIAPPPPPPAPAPPPPPVPAPPAPVPSAPPAPAPAPPNWPLIGGIIVATIVVGLLIFFLIRRRAA